jgi:hypothetical protein
MTSRSSVNQICHGQVQRLHQYRKDMETGHGRWHFTWMWLRCHGQGHRHVMAPASEKNEANPHSADTAGLGIEGPLSPGNSGSKLSKKAIRHSGQIRMGNWPKLELGYVPATILQKSSLVQKCGVPGHAFTSCPGEAKKDKGREEKGQETCHFGVCRRGRMTPGPPGELQRQRCGDNRIGAEKKKAP